MTLGHFTESALLVPRLLGETQANVIRELAGRLRRAERIDDLEGFIAPVMEREAAVPTLIGDGVALPHARGSGIKSLSLAVGFSAGGIPWPGRDSIVHVVFMSAIPFTETRRYLSLLSGLSKLVQDDTAFQNFINSTRAEQMLEVLESYPVDLPQHGNDLIER